MRNLVCFNSLSKTVNCNYKKVEDGYVLFHLAHGYISETNIVFENEKIIINVEAKGVFEFCNQDNELITSAKMIAKEEGPGYYDHICVNVDNINKTPYPLVE